MSESSVSIVNEVLSGGGEMGARMRAVDWSKTPLGPIESWPPSLRSALSICLGSAFPIGIYWGPDLVLLYNDAWSPIPGTKHPWALAQPAVQVWPEIWDAIGPLFERVMLAGESTYAEDSLLLMRRHGYTEECYFNFTFTPIKGAGARIEGVFNAVIETTFRVVSERRTRLLRELSDRTTRARSSEEACAIAAETLGAATKDVPFCGLYLLDEAGEEATLAGVAGLEAGSSALAPKVSLAEPDGVWPLHAVRESGTLHIVTALDQKLGALPGGAWPEPATSAIVAPVLAGVGGRASGFLVLGVNPRRAVDEEYRQFAERAAAQVANVITTTTAFEAERRRAETLAQLDRAKTAFFSNVSHEFRTPLTLMLGPTSDALASADQALKGKELEAVHRNGQRLLKLVNTLLDFSRIEAGRANLRFAATDLATATTELASAFRSLVEKAGLALRVDCPPLPEPVWVDPEMWEKIVLNLLSNAFKFTFEGEIAIALRSAGEHVELTVRDTGTGIPAHALPRLFERFQRVEGAKSRSYEGSGIGLALVQELVKLHGGTIHATSEQGRGTTFTVAIPKGRAHLDQNRLQPEAPSPNTARAGLPFVEEAARWLPATDDDAPESAASDSAAAPLEGHVLVADDNSDMREYVVRLLRQDGLAVTAVANGRAALEAAKRESFDVVLTDVMMPELDGFGLLHAVRADPKLRTLPVMMLSARAGEEATVEGTDAGADDYLAKPFSAKELLSRVRRLVLNARLRRATEESEERFRNMADHAPVMLWVTDARGVCTYLSKGWYDFTGQTEETGLGMGWLSAVHPDDSERSSEIFLEANASTSPFRLEYRLRRKDGEYRWAIDSASPRYGSDGAYLGYVGSVIDITDRKKAEEAMTRLNQTLEERVSERTAQLQQANQELESFSYSVSHDLRAPLRHILGFSQLLEKSPSATNLDAKARKHLTTITEAAERGGQLVDDLLAFSRLGRAELSKKRLSLQQLVAEVRQELALEEANRNIRWTIHPLPEVRGDIALLRQVIRNLLSNALKYTRRRADAVIEIGSVFTSAEVEIWVKDNGVGFDMKYVNKLFGVFSRLHTSEQFEGTGIGLAHVRRIITRHGGRTWAEAAPDLGATIHFTLPV